MTLRQRFNRLTLWNKLGVIASIVGILAFILTVITLLIPERSIPKTAVQLDKNGLQQIKDVVAESIANLKEQENTTNADVRFPGFSFSILIRLEGFIGGRDNYIFDYGENLESNRFSSYMDAERNLCFRVIDQNSQPLVIKVKPALETFDFGRFFYLKCEYGYTNNFSFIRMGINGIQVAENDQTPPILISAPLQKIHGCLALDLSQQNGGVFLAGDFEIYTMTLSQPLEMYWLNYMNEDMKIHRVYISFNGSNGIIAPYFNHSKQK